MPERDITWVRRRAESLKAKEALGVVERNKIATLCNGGEPAVQMLLGNSQKGDQILAPHLLLSGLTRIAQKLQAVPTPKVDPESDADSARDRADRIETLVRFHDSLSRASLQIPQQARWLPAYGFSPITITEKMSGGFRYARSELRDPLDCYPGWWSADAEPYEMAVFRRIDLDALAGFAPKAAAAIRARRADNSRGAGGAVLLDSWQNNYGRTYGTEGSGDPSNMTALIEYWCLEGTYFLLPEADIPLHFVANPLGDTPAFVVPRRFTVDRLGGQYDHVIGLMAMLAKLNLLGLINVEDSTLAPWVVAGQMRGGEKLRFGRFKVNYVEPGTQVTKIGATVPFQVWTQIDRLERQFRIGAGYPVTDDAQSPNSFVTGRGLEELNASANLEVSEYQKILRQALEDVDSKRLAWEEKMYGGTTRPLIGRQGEKVTRRSFDPAVLLDGRWATRRVFGVLSGFDEPGKLVAGQGMVSGGSLSLLSFLEEIDGIEDEGAELVRIRRYRAEQSLMSRFAANPDPALDAVLAQIYTNPGDFDEIIASLVPEPAPAPGPEPALAPAGPGPGGGGGGLGPPPSITTVLNQLNSSGSVEGGIQTVGRSQ